MDGVTEGLLSGRDTVLRLSAMRELAVRNDMPMIHRS
jgi:hypothetical protein